MTFCFGLIHGFGFASVLAELNLPRADFAWALLQFNLGLEIGQLLIVVVATALLFLLRQLARLLARGDPRRLVRRRSRRRAVADRAHRQRLAAAVLTDVTYNRAASSTHYKGEKGMPVMTPRTTTSRPEGVGRRASPHPDIVFLVRSKSAAQSAPFSFLESSHDLDSTARRFAAASSRPGDGGRSRRVDRRRPGQGRARRPRRRGQPSRARRHELSSSTTTTPLAIVTDKDADGLEIIRHSTAHLLAYAVKELFPDAQVTIGPVIENGFYYDFSYKRPFTPEDLAAIEAKMTELAKKDEPVERRVLPRDEAVAHFKRMGEALQGRDHRRASRPARTSRSTARARSRTCAAARTCRARASSSTSS